MQTDLHPVDVTQANRLVVIGQGYVGLPVAMQAVKAGMHVIGLDNATARVRSLQDGVSFVEDISSEDLQAALDTGRYHATTEYSQCADFTHAVITVPTPLREYRPDLSYIEDACRGLAPFLRPGCTVVLESTTYPGTTDQLVANLFIELTGLKPDTDYNLGFSPERIDPGNPVWNFQNTPKLVAGCGPISQKAVVSFYERLVETVIPVSNTRVAELAKLMENTFRHVNIALVNELALYANELGVDIWETIDAASTKPFGFTRFEPGPGVGGHCLPIDPSYLSWAVKRSLGHTFRFVELANDINEHMPDHVVQRATSVLNLCSKPLRGAKIIVFGYAYKRNVGDVRESPAVRIVSLLLARGARVCVVDPHVDPAEISNADFRSSIIEAELADMDLGIIVTDHDIFDYTVMENVGVPFVDTRRRLNFSLDQVFGL